MKRVNISKLELPDAMPEVPEGFRARSQLFSPDFGALKTHAILFELPAGEAVCPYHYEYGDEQWTLVLSGTPTVRTPQGTQQLEPFDMVFFPAGPDGAHQLRNDTDSTVRLLGWSNASSPMVTAYPDSGKVGVWTHVEGEDLVVRRASEVGYFDGESNPPGKA